jgi:hypothetical protein
MDVREDDYDTALANVLSRLDVRNDARDWMLYVVLLEHSSLHYTFKIIGMRTKEIRDNRID